MVAATRSASSLQRRMAGMVYRSGDAAANVVPGVLTGSRVVLRRHVPGEPGRVPHAGTPTPRSPAWRATRRRPMRAEEIERFFAARVVGPDALAMAIHERTAPADRHVRVQPARRRQRLGAVPHHHRREGRLGPGLRHRGDPAHARPRVRDARACTASRCSCSSSTSGRSAPTSAAGSSSRVASRESIWRDGRWWDELAMSVLESDWRRQRSRTPRGRGARCSSTRTAWRPIREPSGAAGESVARRAAAPGHRAAAMTSAGRGGRRRPGRGPRADRGQGPRVDNARAAVARLEAAFADGDLERTPSMDLFLGDLMHALEQDEGQKLGRQERRGGAVHPARHRPRARQRPDGRRRQIAGA